jgi:hypothetical protein
MAHGFVSHILRDYLKAGEATAFFSVILDASRNIFLAALVKDKANYSAPVYQQKHENLQQNYKVLL